ncbi:STAS domain-containing protein [Pseudonocardia broussonetiae]|uniref:STAS domain-containing protein n=1 Tax=Pseudonocardia broussonetiae TaxID=2736640 RepID=A0A6M6JN89_9PSEU|nr:STAS domain-containing protein [Pseudonocardia broussonetiae]QJY48815.1 STAS domain-containing protein [Pseudonocardia broussonetiae]
MDPSIVPLHTVRVGDPDADDVVVCEVRGEIDVSNVGELHAGLAEAFARGRAVVVDLSRVHFFASAGIRALFDACADHSPDRPMAVVTGPGVRTILRICGLASVAPCLSDREAAARACGDALSGRRS